jgi:hypothetical protein
MIKEIKIGSYVKTRTDMIGTIKEIKIGSYVKTRTDMIGTIKSSRIDVDSGSSKILYYVVYITKHPEGYTHGEFWATSLTVLTENEAFLKILEN